MIFIRKNIRLLFVLVLPVYLYIVQNSILNKHSHIYSNGLVVTHSHPLENEGETPGSKHNHSKTEICLFSCLSFDYYSAPALFQLDFELENQMLEFLIKNDQSNYYSPHLKTIPCGPPSL